MKKQRLQLITLLIILLAAVGGYFGLKAYNEKQSNAPSESTYFSVFDIAMGELTAFSYDYEGVEYSFVREENSWLYEGDTTLDIDEGMISSILNNVDNISSDTEITGVTDYEQYGLETPARTITLVTAEQEYKLYFGDYNDMIAKYYLQVDGKSEVYTTSGSRYMAFDFLPQDIVVETETEEAE